VPGRGCSFAQAQDSILPKPIKIIVPYVPGGATDIVARISADQMGKSLGQSVIVENKPGAFGIIAIEDMVKFGADGLHRDDRQCLPPTRFRRSSTRRNFKIDYFERRGADHNVVDIPAFLVATTKDFDAKSVPERSTTQEKSRKRCVTARSAGQLSALRHGLFRQARRRSRHDRDTEQGRCPPASSTTCSTLDPGHLFSTSRAAGRK